MNIQCNHIKSQQYYTKSLQGKKIYKDQCVRCFEQPTNQDGLFVCMKCFNGVCKNHIQEHMQCFNQHVLYVNVKMIKKNQEGGKIEITKLAIGKEGGAQGDDEYDTLYKIYCIQCHFIIQQGSTVLQPQIKSLINTQSPFKKQSLISWQAQILPCQHSLTLHQLPINKNLLKCSDCQLSTNLWLCLTCGNTGCGRKYFDGTGGNNHAIDHYQNSKHPLVVKLGTITAEGQASLYCYQCNNDVKDQYLKQHMQVLGIDFGSQKKTQKTVAQMNLQFNLNFMLSKQLQSELNDKIMYGQQYTGMNNIGNSCYLNSVIQVLNSLKQFKGQYFEKGQEHIMSCKAIPAQCFYCQMAKIAIGLNSGQYSSKLQRKRIINDKQVIQDYQKGISPYDFKLLIAQNNAQFSSPRQQDAEEYLQWLFDRLNKQQGKYGQKLSELFDFKLTNRMVCQTCKNYKQVTQNTNLWKFPVPQPNQKDIQKFYQYLQTIKDPDMKKSKQCQQPEYQVKFLECLNIMKYGDCIQVKCQKCNNSNKEFISHNYFKTTPKYLIAMANRFVIQKWVPKKLNAILEMPQKLDLEQFLLKNIKNQGLGQLMKQQKKKQYSQQNLQMLQSMGYVHNGAIRALIATKNDIQGAINWMMDHMGDADFDKPIEQQNKGNVALQKINQASVYQIQQMGFEDYQAQVALIKNNGKVEQAIQWLFNIGGDVSQFLHLLQPSKQQNNIPVNLSQLPFESEQQINSKYSLKAVIVHLGKSVHSGHYVSYIKKQNKWVLFNDEKVILQDKPVLGKGYLYVYERME